MGIDDDDRPVGRVLSRREVLALMGGSALIACAPQVVTPSPSPRDATASPSPTDGATAPGTPAGSAALPACVVRPEQSEGPFYVDEDLERSDIRSDPASGAVSQGAPLTLAFNVLRVNGSTCAALPGAIVDVWHCDAAGVYSDVTGNSQKFLRGHQVTDASGRASFTTIYPGWYQGRAVHIHFKIRSGNEEFTSQLYFDEAVSDRVFQQAPYSQRGAGSRTRNSGDALFRNGGAELLLAVTPSGGGYAATFDIGLVL